MHTGQDCSAINRLLERRNAELASMIEIGKTLTSCLDPHDILEAIMKQVERLINPKAWSLLLVDANSGDLTFEIAVSPVAEQLKGFRLKRGEGVAGWVALNGEALLIPDVSQDQRFARHLDEKLSFTTHSIVCVPMKIKQQVVGVIELINSYQESIFENNDLVLLSAIADFAAIALENARNYQRINELVMTDDVSGLYNSRHFGKLLEHELERAKRYNDPLSLVFLDLDKFKSVNDQHGHLVGSRMLAEFGQLIRRQIRSSDLAARYGGDEFSIILPHTTKQQAIKMASALLASMKNTRFVSDDNLPINLTASFGVASFPEDAESKADLIRAADVAMYAVKESGRGAVRGFSLHNYIL